MLLTMGAVIAGFLILIWGADRFVMGAAALARNSGISPLLIGLTIVGFGTSAPEIMVSGMAAFQGNPNLAVGNAVGSNIANIGLILGFTALLSPLLVRSSILRREYPLLLGISTVVYFLLLDGELSLTDSIFMLLGLLGSLVWLVRIGIRRASDQDPLAAESDAEIPTDMSTLSALLWFIIGLTLLLLSSRLLVWGAVQIATTLGVSDLVIGLTIVAIGTSLPELAASVMSALKNEHDLAVGNIIGSNIYNLLAVLPMPGLIASTTIGDDVLTRDFPLLLILTIALLILGFGRQRDGRINRLSGSLLLISFVFYQGWLVFQAQPTLNG